MDGRSACVKGRLCMCEGKVVHVWRESCACVDGRKCEGQLKV